MDTIFLLLFSCETQIKTVTKKVHLLCDLIQKDKHSYEKVLAWFFPMIVVLCNELSLSKLQLKLNLKYRSYVMICMYRFLYF